MKRLGNWVIHQIIGGVQRLMDSSLTSPTDVLLGTLPSIFSQVDPQLLQAHPHNSSIYGEEDVTDLVELIRQSKWIKPLVVTSSLTIISGHRRWKAVLKLGWSTVPIEVRELATEEEELEALLLENASRVKTTEQKVREAEAWKSLEQRQARKRMSEAGQKSAPGKPAEEKGVENFPHLSSKGKTRDLRFAAALRYRLAKLVGLGSGRTYSKAAKVVEVIDRETCSGNLETAQTLRQALNSKSVDAAWNLLKHPQQLTSRKTDITLVHETSATRSCWSCQHRGELIGNDSFYCERLGMLSLLEQDADTRGDSCDLWSQIQDTSSQTKNYTLTLSFSPELRSALRSSASLSLLEDTARDAGMSVVDWAHHQLKKAALSASRANQPGSLQSLLNKQFIEQLSGRGQN